MNTGEKHTFEESKPTFPTTDTLNSTIDKSLERQTLISTSTKEHVEIPDLEELLKYSDKPHYVFFIFVNPTSGENRAAALINLEVEQLIFSSFKPNGSKVEVHFHDLLDPMSKEVGLQLLKVKQADEGIDVRVIVGGGDGTIIWVIEEMIRVGVNFKKCAIGCIPFGTGNDFARSLGWGGAEPSVLVGPNMKNLKGMIKQWAEATPQDFDIWDVTVEVHEEGGFRRIHKSGSSFEKKFVLQNDPTTGRQERVLVLKKKMCNYYSFGVDARIGYGFDKYRTASRFCNKTIYAIEGIKKLFFRTFKMNEILHRVEDIKEQEQDIEMGPPQDQDIDKIEYIGKDFLLFPSGSKETRPRHVSVIKGNPSVFLCLNISSYMGGAGSPWKSSKGKVGVTDYIDKTLTDFDDQSFGDSKLEIISFSGPIALGLERLLPGQGRRVGQAKGPLLLNFKRSENRDKPLNTYMQVDGEYFEVIAPKSVKLTLAREIPEGKVRVLVKKGSK